MRESVHYVVADSSLGKVAVAATSIGVCHVALADEAGPLVTELCARFPEAVDGRNDPELAAWCANVVGRVEVPAAETAPPLDLGGTEFQRHVWDALCEIAPGSTLTYGALAGRIGIPNGERAVAGACARNPVAVIVPCHRVLRQDGGLGGYRWETWRKRALLEREGALLV